MKVRRQFTILGCSSSPGVPRINGDWGKCDPDNPKNRRRRAALLVRQIGPDGGVTTVVIDTGPDFREQMIDARVQAVDAVLYTHAHADHIHGIDDLRGFALTQRRQIPIYAEAATLRHLRASFGYCLETPVGSAYPPIIEARLIADPDKPIVIDGEGGPLTAQPLVQKHGDIISLGFRFGDVAYCCDVSDFPRATVARLADLDMIIIDALQYREHPSHLSIDQALWWVDKLGARNAVLTHMHTPLDYQTVLEETPEHVQPGYDGLTLDYEVEL
ncbi:MBL fold metallo-hydrolase [Pseudohoeflea coraliihabitans]|uniref:MBL fold metallo-hydrolase n=1 Tax=Pseudohoeflea coraliihabitans TaxID=2860393 RepID=A0ABS6WQX3_9HYPH|nr:MBL fold metallo-hydrolase [Pseudohoeflea sp. DP4N28-3]MBW3098372.1 MBL fold metallo-hydrolase [Pseudohoeflea sp. DP4N28-3]